MQTCPSCDKDFQGPRCHCGHSFAEINKPLRRASPVEQIADELRTWLSAGGTLPHQLIMQGEGCEAAAQRWVDLQGLRQPREFPRTVYNAGLRRTVDPYVDRLRATIRLFLRLADGERDIVVLAAAEKVYWRGEELSHFISIYNETCRSRSIGTEAYRAEHRRDSDRLVGSTRCN